jgi:hypothetical protein
MKAVMAKDALVRCPDHAEEFHVDTDASDCQLGAVMMQKGAPVAFCSRKLNPAQRDCATMEEELLSIVETLKEFQTMPHGCEAPHVHTDHQNLTHDALNSQRVLRWRLFLEEFQPQFHHIKGADSTTADALSRPPRSAGQRIPGPSQPKSPTDVKPSLTDDCDAATAFSILIDNQDTLERFLNYPDVDEEHPFALDHKTIPQAQNNDVALLQSLASKPTKFGPNERKRKSHLLHARSKPTIQNMHSRCTLGCCHPFLPSCA